MTAFETLYAHLKAMNYKDAPLFADGQLLFLNVGENYHILYSGDSLFVVNFVDSIVQHYHSNTRSLSSYQSNRDDYLKVFDELPTRFLYLMPAYLYHLELSKSPKFKNSIFNVWPKAAEYDFWPSGYSGIDCTSEVRYDIKELFFFTIGWTAKYSHKAQLNSDDFGTTICRFNLDKFGDYYKLSDIESDKQFFYYCDYNKHLSKKFSQVYKKDIMQLNNLDKTFSREWEKKFTDQDVTLNRTRSSINNFLSYEDDLEMRSWSPFSANKFLLKINKKDSFYDLLKQYGSLRGSDFCQDDVYFDGERIIQILKDNYPLKLSKRNQEDFINDYSLTQDSLKLFISYDLEQIAQITKILNSNHYNEVHLLFTNLKQSVKNDMAQLDKMFEILEQYRQAKYSQLVSVQEILDKMHQDYLGDAPII